MASLENLEGTSLSMRIREGQGDRYKRCGAVVGSCTSYDLVRHSLSDKGYEKPGAALRFQLRQLNSVSVGEMPRDVA